jgi:hypothetical protein
VIVHGLHVNERVVLDTTDTAVDTASWCAVVWTRWAWLHTGDSDLTCYGKSASHKWVAVHHTRGRHG